jgi:hypothetical protein
VWRSGSRSAQELVFGLFVPWRGNPTAVCIMQPIQFLREAIRKEVLAIEALPWLLSVNATTGPVHAFITACNRAGLEVSPDATSLFNEGVRIAWTCEPWYLVRQSILKAHSIKSFTALAGRRPVFAALLDGVDRGLTLQFESAPWQESRKAALRVVLTGGVIVQKLASKWVAGGDRCPHCKLAVEDLSHLFWACPRWEKLRHTSLGSQSKAVLLQLFGPDALTTGIIPSNRVLMDAQIAAEASGSWPAPVHLPGRVWTDGSCLFPADSPLRRATWAVVGRMGVGFHTLGSAIVHGRQTIGRAELSAVIWVSRCPGNATAVIDAKYLTFCLARCLGNTCPADLLEGRNGDLWRLLLRQVTVVWVKAHLTAAQAVALSINEVDRQGNDAADIAAATLARSIAPSQEMVGNRDKWKVGAATLHNVLSAIQEAALEVHHAPGSAVRARKRAKRARPKPKVKRPAIAQPVLPPLAQPGAGAIVHELCPAFGPVSTRVGATWACNRCEATATGATRWSPFAKALCHADPRAVHAIRDTRVHALARVVGGWACLRCRLAVPAARRAAAARTNCPVPEYLLFGRDTCPATRAQILQNLAAIALWKTQQLPIPVAESAAPAAAPPAPPVRLVWRSHWIVKGGGRSACLACGRTATARARIGLDASACPGISETPSAALTGPLLAGNFDAALDRAPPAWLARAGALQWRSLPARRVFVGNLVRSDPAALPPD